jgi:putative sigma-54 modulation protein
MRLFLRSRGVDTSEALRLHLERRVNFALGRFGGRVGWVVATFVDENGPRGGVDKVCRIVAEVRGTAPVVIEDADPDLYAAIDRAADRLGRSVARGIDRERGRFFRSPVLATD